MKKLPIGSYARLKKRPEVVGMIVHIHTVNVGKENEDTTYWLAKDVLQAYQNLKYSAKRDDLVPVRPVTVWVDEE